MTSTKRHWEAVYSGKSPVEVSWYQKEPTLSLRLIKNSRVGKDEPIIDVGGGASLLIDWLIAEGYQRPAMLDISAKAMAIAKARLGERANAVEWFEADITQFSAPHSFSLWHDRAVFHFLVDQGDRKKYVEVLKRTLRPGGYLIIAAFAIGGPIKCSGLDVVQYDAQKLLHELGEGFEFKEEVGEDHITPSGKVQQFCYFHLVRR